MFQDMLSDGYDGALHLSLGRVIEVSVAAMRLVLSGTMERHPDLKIVMSHTGGSLPYQSGRMDKNSKAAKLPKPVSTYLKRMYTDTVSPHSAGMKFAIDYYGIDNVMYGTDYPCWEPAQCLKLLEEVKLSEADKQKLFYDNARRILGLKDPAPAKRPSASRRWLKHSDCAANSLPLSPLTLTARGESRSGGPAGSRHTGHSDRRTAPRRVRVRRREFRAAGSVLLPTTRRRPLPGT